MATKTLDITKEHCPMTFVKTKIELSRLQTGDILEVLLSEGEPLNDKSHISDHSIVIHARGNEVVFDMDDCYC